MDINSLGGSSFAPKALREMMHDKKRAAEDPLLAEGIKIEEKDYTKATLTGMQAQNTQVSQQNAILNAAMADVSASGSYAMRNLAGKRAARRMMDDMQKRVAEESERNLEENRNAVAEQAAAGAQGSTATVDAAAAAAGAVSAPAVATGSAPTPAPSPEEVAPAASAAPAAPAAPSLNVTV